MLFIQSWWRESLDCRDEGVAELPGTLAGPDSFPGKLIGPTITEALSTSLKGESVLRKYIF